MNYLGIDFGTKKIGLAKADEETKIATPLKTIPNNDSCLSSIEDIIKEEDIKVVVLGVPISFDGEEREMAKKTRRFGEELKKIVFNLKFQNEVLTTKQAQRYEVSDKDSSAAALILQGFLDRS